MKKFTFILILIVLISCKHDTKENFIEQAFVQDYSDLFSVAEEQKLIDKIIRYEALTTNQICIYTIDSIPNKEDVFEYATKISNKLGVGTQEKNNGLLFLISRYDRKLAIATGIETEKTITDSITSIIINKTIVPKFNKDSLYFEGMLKGLDSVMVKWS